MLRACRFLRQKAGPARTELVIRRIVACIATCCLLSGIAAYRLHAQTAPPSVLLQPASPADSFVAPLIGAGFRFAARITRHQPTTGALSSQGPFATRVEVDTVFRAPPSIGELRGRSLTIVLQDTTALPRDRPAVIIAAGITFGTEIVLRTQAHVPLASLAQAPDVAAIIKRADSLIYVAAVRRFAAEADAVFLGTVLAIANSFPNSALFARRGEHDPAWREADVRVDSPYGSGALRRGTRVRVLFPGSRDMAYRFSPRLELGTQSLILARKAQRLLSDTLTVPVPRTTYFVVRAFDVRPAQDSNLVRLPPP